MSKKRGKSGSAPTGFGVKWESELMNASLEEDTWKISVNFVVENLLDDELHIKHLANVVKIPQRKLFSYVKKEELMALIDEIGNPKTRKTKDLPHYFEVTEVIKSLLDAGEEIPLHLYAKLIKFALINIKLNDLKRRENESKFKDDKGSKGSDVSACSLSSVLVPGYKPFVDVWKFMWRNIIEWAALFNGVAVQVGPIFDYDSDGHADTTEVLSRNATLSTRAVGCTSPIPTHYYVSVMKCKEHRVINSIRKCLKSLRNTDILNFIIPNYKEDACHEGSDDIKDWAPLAVSRHVARIRDIELLTGLSFFHTWRPGKAPIEDVLLSIQTKLILPETTDRWMKIFMSQSNFFT